MYAKKNVIFLWFTCVIFTIIQETTGKTGYFWHVTDFHLDVNYTTEGDPTRMCWTWGAASAASETPSEFGDYNCDAPFLLVNSSVHAMKKIFPQPDFILWTGDDTAHVNDSFFSTDVVVGVVTQISDVIKGVFPDTLVLPVLGNHDFFPQNQAPVGPSELQTRVADLWKDWLSPFKGAYDDFKNDGRYVAHIPDSKVSFVALNTLLWYEANELTASDENATDPARQFEWADRTIQSLLEDGRVVYLMGHIPPGMFERYFDERQGFHWYQERYNKQYINLIRKHGRNVTAQFFGHHHTDSFRVFLSDDKGHPLSFLLIAPAVSPMRSTLSRTAGALNPAIRLIAYDTVDGQVEEVSQYYLDLVRANSEGKDDWVLEYNLTDALQLQQINADTLYGAVLRMKEDKDFFELYYPINTVQWQNASQCPDDCRRVQLCSFTEIDYSEFYNCNGGWTPLTSSMAFAFVIIIIWNCLSPWRN